MTEETIYVCNPCREDHHLECDTTKHKPCLCLICYAARVGEPFIGEPIVEKRKRWPRR